MLDMVYPAPHKMAETNATSVGNGPAFRANKGLISYWCFTVVNSGMTDQ
jgi:hypothetical protein